MQLLFLDRELDREVSPLGAADYGLALIQGYGQQRDGSAGELMQGVATIESFLTNPASIRTGSGPDACFGDSGGPLYQDGAVVGVTRQAARAITSDNPIDSCGGGGLWTPVVTYKDWLDSEVGNLQWVSYCS
jgi:secreted trypsin-like serine protease